MQFDAVTSVTRVRFATVSPRIRSSVSRCAGESRLAALREPRSGSDFHRNRYIRPARITGRSCADSLRHERKRRTAGASERERETIVAIRCESRDLRSPAHRLDLISEICAFIVADFRADRRAQVQRRRRRDPRASIRKSHLDELPYATAAAVEQWIMNRTKDEVSETKNNKYDQETLFRRTVTTRHCPRPKNSRLVYIYTCVSVMRVRSKETRISP